MINGGAVKCPLGPEHRRRQDQCDHNNREYLVDLGADQDAVCRQIGDIVPGNHRIARRRRDGVNHQHQPADDGHGTGNQNVLGLKPECAQCDEDKHIDHGRRPQIEGRRLIVFNVEAPDQRHQQANIHDHGKHQKPAGQEPLIGTPEPDHGEQEIQCQCPGLQAKACHLGRRRRQDIENAESHHQNQLNPADQLRAFELLFVDLFMNAGRHVAGNLLTEYVKRELLPHANATLMPCADKVVGTK